MELKLVSGDYAVLPGGRIEEVSGEGEILQRVVMKLIAPRKTRSPLPDFGCGLGEVLNAVPSEQRSRAQTAVCRVLMSEPGVKCEAVTLSPGESGAGVVAVRLRCGESLGNLSLGGNI